MKIVADLLEKGLLSRYPECPVCGSIERIPRSLPFNSNGYIAAGARRLAISEGTLCESLQGQECLSCRAVYFDPWLSVHLQKELYESLSPQHNVGWDTFWRIIRNPADFSRDQILYQSMREQIPTLKRYAELGCPFTGLLPYLSVKQYQYKSKEFWDYPGAFSLNSRFGNHPQVKGNRLNFERLGCFIAQSLNRIQLMRVFPLRRLVKRSLIRLGQAREVQHDGINCYYIQHDSSILWGKNCKSLGVDCRTALENVFGVQTVNFQDIQTEKISFEIVAIFNSLDHYKNPIKLLSEIFNFTNYIYIEGQHGRGDWGKQHSYFLEENTTRMLPKLLPVAEPVPDFKGRPREGWYSILLRKKEQIQKNNLASKSLKVSMAIQHMTIVSPLLLS